MEISGIYFNEKAFKRMSYVNFKKSFKSICRKKSLDIDSVFMKVTGKKVPEVKK